MSASLTLAKLKARFAKAIKGPGWPQYTITYEELREYLLPPTQPEITAWPPAAEQLFVKNEYKIQYYLHDYDNVGQFIYMVPDNCMWVEYKHPPNLGETIKIQWSDIDWNAFGIFHNDGFEFNQVERT